jgi:hypothetical protein
MLPRHLSYPQPTVKAYGISLINNLSLFKALLGLDGRKDKTTPIHHHSTHETP